MVGGTLDGFGWMGTDLDGTGWTEMDCGGTGCRTGTTVGDGGSTGSTMWTVWLWVCGSIAVIGDIVLSVLGCGVVVPVDGLTVVPVVDGDGVSGVPNAVNGSFFLAFPSRLFGTPFI